MTNEGKEMIQSVTKIVEWDMGHRVPNHKSKCRNMHGHRYKAEVTIIGDLCDVDGSSSEGMVVDFGDIKQIMMEDIHDPFDHGFMYYTGDPLLVAIVDQIKASGMTQKLIPVDFIPTAENLAKFIWCRLEDRLDHDDCLELGLHVHKVRLYETPNSWADYGPRK